MDEPWRRLAAAAGIEPGYWDGLGTRRDLTETTARALLASLGLDADVADARAIEFADWTTALPALVQVAPASSFGVDVTLPPDAAGQTLAWQVRLESGDLQEGSSALPHEHTAETRDIDGAVRTRFRLTVELAAPLAPGYHRLILPDHNAAAALLAVPARCHIPAFLAAGGRCWGLAVQLYSLRSARNWGIGDFTDLARIATIAGHAGAALIGLNPLHARHLARPDDASPYAPSSRLALDPMLLDIEAIAEFATCDAARAMVAAPAFQARLNAARATELVDHAAVAALKLPVLALLFDHFRARPAATDTRSAAYTAFVARGGADLEHFATFEARRLWLLEQDGKLAGWRDWPADWQDPHGACVRAFRAQHAASVEFQFYLQWQADLQLQAAARAATAAGMRIGLYRDLAVGAAADGAECWSGQDLIARDASVGAPPDLLNREGQDWGLPPWNPRVLLRREYAPLRTLLMENMRAAGALRIDHVMALTRLFWIPAGMRGAAGGYVRNAFEILAGIVAIESVRNQCMIIGEDLGSVPDGLRDALAARGFLSYRVLLFERHWSGDGSFKRPWEYPAQALATVVTHDMPTIAEYWSGGDIARRDKLGLFPEPALREAEVARREPERQALLQLLAELGLAAGAPPAPPALTAALHAAVARCHAMLAVVQLDDISGETEPVNIPGTHLEYPNWRRKLALDIEDLAADPRFAQLADTMRGAGRA